MTSRTHWGVGAQLREVIVISLDLSHSVAHCREVNTSHTVEVSILPVRVKVPVVGERWLVDRTFGMWSFGALLASPDLLKVGSPASSDGVVGLIRATSTSVAKGAGLAYVNGWSFDTPTNTPIPGPVPQMVQVGDNFNPVKSGWYTVKGYINLSLTVTPTYITLTLNGGGSTSTGDTTTNMQDITPRQFTDGYYSTAPFYVWGDGLDPTMPNVGILGCSIEWSGSSVATSFSAQLDVVRIA